MYLNFQHLVDSFARRGHKIYSRMFDGERFISVSYNKLYHNSCDIAAYLQKKLSLKKNDRVILISENRPEWMMSYFGIVYNGIVAVPLDMMLSPEEIFHLVQNIGSETVFISNTVFEKLKTHKELFSIIKTWIVFDKNNDLEKQFDNIVFLSDIYQTAGLNLDRNEVMYDDLASLIFTSGTTGQSKAVMLSHGNFMHQVNNLPYSAQLVEKDVFLSVLPLHHTFQFSVEMTVLGLGASVTYAESLKPNRLIEAIKTTSVSIMIGIPALYAKILDGIYRNINQQPAPVKQIINLLYKISSSMFFLTRSHKVGEKLFGFLRKKAGLGSVRFMISGAAPLAFSVAKGYAVFGFNLANGYGLTEASPVVSVGFPLGPIDNKSVGNPVPGVSWKIMDPDIHGVGEICVKGENVMKGYLDNPQATQNVITEDGWLKTGDMGYLAKRANKEFLYITGRYKNIIVTSGGKNVYPEEIEELINAHPFILESLVMGVSVSDDDMSEVVCALVVLDIPYLEEQGIDPKASSTISEIDSHIRKINSKLHMYQAVRSYEIKYEELIKNSTRKIKRFDYPGKEYRYLLENEKY